jgi:hypothetical protein
VLVVIFELTTSLAYPQNHMNLPVPDFLYRKAISIAITLQLAWICHIFGLTAAVSASQNYKNHEVPPFG